MQTELEIAFPARFAGLKVNTYAERSRDLLAVECAQLLADDEEPFEQQIADLKTVLLQIAQPPLLHPNAATNPLREMERSFENAYAELETYFHVQAPSAMSLFSFFSRLEYIEKQTKAAQHR